MRKDSFIVRREWCEGVAELPEKDQLEMWKALSAYALDGEEPKLKPIQMAIFKIIQATLDANAAKYEKTRHDRSEAGKKGMAKRWKHLESITNDNKNNNAITNDNKNNLIVSDSVIVSSDEDIKETIPKGIAKKKQSFSLGVMDIQKIFSDYESSATDESYRKFLIWTKENTPYIARHLRPVSEEQFLKLKGAYGSEIVRVSMENLENRKDMRKKYTDLYRTLLNWCHNESGRRP